MLLGGENEPDENVVFLGGLVARATPLRANQAVLVSPFCLLLLLGCYMLEQSPNGLGCLTVPQLASGTGPKAKSTYLLSVERSRRLLAVFDDRECSILRHYIQFNKQTVLSQSVRLNGVFSASLALLGGGFLGSRNNILPVPYGTYPRTPRYRTVPYPAEPRSSTTPQ